MYNFVFVDFVDIDDMSERRNHIDVDASALVNIYPSSEIEFWNDIRVDI